MRPLMVAFLIAGPAFFGQGLFAQGRGGGVRSGATARRPVAPVRTAPPAPVARPVPVGPAIASPAYFLGYYPNPFYYGSGYVSGPGYYGYDPSQGDGGQGYAAQGYPGQGYPGQGVPPVIVNTNYVPETANPVLRDYSYMPVPDATPQQGADQNNAPPTPSVIFLIAMKDHTIYPAIAYWVEDDTLNYITEQGVRNRVSLDLVDRDFSTQLNKDRSIDFALPHPANALPQADTQPQAK